MAILDLTGLNWSVEGWRPFSWKLGKSMETGFGIKPDIEARPMRVPGTVQAALRDAGVIPDWNIGFNSRACEWVEHRHWLMETVIPAGSIAPGETVMLEAESLDYWGWILVDCAEAARFEGSSLPHRIDLTEKLGDGKEHRLAAVFEEPPREQGQIGFTSRSHFFKARYNYSWDWCPRFVPIGVSGRFRLLTGASASVALQILQSRYDLETGHGCVEAVLDGADEVSRWTLGLFDGDKKIAGAENTAGTAVLAVEDVSVAAWWPNGYGAQQVYTAEVRAFDADGGECLVERRTVGFREVDWWQNEGAPAGAEPWTCVVNGTPVFLGGANWVPVLVNHQDVTAADYAKRVHLYKDMGCTVLRVWGGAILESETFYDLCDRAGILVWQEFPLSSSGIENAPPDNPAAIAALKPIAVSYVRRRAHHPSLLLWCGGNELYYGESPDYPPCQKPVDLDHPCIAMLAAVVAEEDPDRRFLTASASGPVDYAQPHDYGKGIHHDIHGPWGQGLNPDMDAWTQYWAPDDSLFRSEVGFPGAMDADLILKYAGDAPCWPPEGEFWWHTAAWWTQWGDAAKAAVAGLEGQAALEKYVAFTQDIQAKAYAIAAGRCRERFPQCGGFIVWMGHDCFPCPANNSLIDFEGRPKPACAELKEIFKGGQA